MDHEDKQSAAIRRLAQAVADLGVGCGHSGHKSLPDEIDAILADDVAPAQVADAPDAAPAVSVDESPKGDEGDADEGA